MSKLKAVAEALEEVVPGIWRWQVLDECIGSESDAHAVSDPTATVLIDPLPLREEALKRMEPIMAIGGLLSQRGAPLRSRRQNWRSANARRRSLGRKLSMPWRRGERRHGPRSRRSWLPSSPTRTTGR